MEKIHQVVMTERNLLTVSKLNEVISFDDTTVNLDIDGAVLTVSGNGLTIQKLSIDNKDSSEVVISGTIDAIVYTDGQRKRRKLFG